MQNRIYMFCNFFWYFFFHPFICLWIIDIHIICISSKVRMIGIHFFSRHQAGTLAKNSFIKCDCFFFKLPNIFSFFITKLLVLLALLTLFLFFFLSDLSITSLS